MYCNQCGKEIDEDSIYCQFCGSEISSNASEPTSENTSQKEVTQEQNINSSNTDLLWDKFADVYDAKGDDKKKYDELYSDQVWELIDRLYTNTFETYIQENKQELNSQPYKIIEALKNMFLFSVIGGYKLWIAEAILEKKPLGKFRVFDLDELVKEWKSHDFQNAIKGLSDAMGNCMSLYLEHKISSFIENNPSIKEVSNATIEDIKRSVLVQIINGYHAGEIESKFRK
ncbi:MAG: zinc ribbon domain-containing protein [bacterium]|nr:zinc ribbon domain-containing protein [bacterium]